MQSSLGSSLTAVKGLQFSRLSTPMKIVSNSSSLTSASPSTAKIARFADLIIDSKTPPQHGAAGGFHFQLTPLLDVIHCILSWSIAETRSHSSLDVLTKFVPLLLINICCGHPLHAVILTKVLRNVSVSKDNTISKWQQYLCLFVCLKTQRVARTLPRPCLVKKGPQKSTAQLSKGL